MTDKQIIIDDCIHLDEWKHCNICEKLIKTKDGANGKKREHLLTEEDLRCDFYPNCYYKQLKKKEQECEELKKIINEAKNSKLDLKSFLVCEAVQNEYEQQLDQLKQTLIEIKNICKTNVCKHCHSKLKVDDNYCKNIKDCDCYKILQKKSECEVENE